MEVDTKEVGTICEKHTGGGGSLVMLLQDIQGRYGYLPREVLKEASRNLGVPLARLYGLATFYRSFSLKPRGRHEICACTGTACHVRGARLILEQLERRLGIRSGDTTGDREFTLVSVNCLGACALGPVVVVDGKYHGKVTVGDVDEILAAVKGAAAGEKS